MWIKQTRIWKFFSSIKLAIWLLAIIALFSLIGTFIPQNQEAEFYTAKYGQKAYGVLFNSGLINIYGSWWFILFLTLFSLNLLACFLNRFSLKIRLLSSMLSHFGILIILLGALIGMLYGQKGLMRIREGEEVSSFVTGKGQVNLEFSIRLDDFIYNENIGSKEKLLVYRSQKDAFCSLHGLKETDKNEGLLASASTEIGAVTQIADTGYKIRILRYLPDFVMDTSTKIASSRSAVPNNPAIEIELHDKNGKVKTFWAFARFPDMHQETEADFKFVYNWAQRQPKDFISKVTITKGAKEIMSQDIRVNQPLRFGGYTFFQSSYDSEGLSWSGLQIVKDPGVPVVYAGFILLILGLMIIFYVKPLIESRL